MTPQCFHLLKAVFASAAMSFALAELAAAEPRHAIAMYGEPALPPDFVALPHVNPDAPKGGRIIMGEAGGFDSLHPFVDKGQAPGMLIPLTVETLMGRSYDEPFSLYGLLAESVETDDSRSFVSFTLREGARFADGSPVTVEDVLWSMETLGTQGAQRYRTAWSKVAKATATGPRTVRFEFNTADRELPLILGMRPILKKAQYDGVDFAASSQMAPVGSGPYVVASHVPGRQITFRRNPDWWGRDLPFNRGQHNFDEVRVEYFADASVVFEAFKAGEITVYREPNPAKWAVNYRFPAVTQGKVVLEEIPHGRPSGIEGLVFNTRRPAFADWRVRQALIHAFNFELANQTVSGGVLPRIRSYFGNSDLGADVTAPAPADESALLAPFADSLPPSTLTGYALPQGDGTEANRANIRKARALLEGAGWTVQDGVLKNAAGQPFAFEILLQQGNEDMAAAATIYVESLKRLGIAARITTVDAAQYKLRTNDYDFDMTHYIRALSLSPGNEQTLYWGARGVTDPGTRNWMGMNSPAAEALIDTMLNARAPDEFRVAVRALDRVLTAGAWVVPVWFNDRSRIARDARLHHPDHLPLYGDWTGFLPDVWWQAPNQP